MFLGYQDSLIAYVADTEEELLNSDYEFTNIVETEEEYINYYGKYLTKDEAEQKEREALKLLSLTKREIFLALYKDKGITPEEIRVSISDPAVLIEFDYANEYYRGNPLVDLIGNQLGYTSKELDYLFKNKEFPKKDVIENENIIDK